MNSSNFFAELKRRNVYKVAVAYAVVGWLLVQVATQVFPFFEIPNWAVRLVVLAIVDWISDRAGHRMGIRADAGRNEAHGRCRSAAAADGREIYAWIYVVDRGCSVFGRIVFYRSLHGAKYGSAARTEAATVHPFRKNRSRCCRSKI